MRANHVKWCLALAVGLPTVWLASTLSAKPNAADRQPALAVAYLDVGRVFEKYPPLQDALKAMKEDATEAEEILKKRRASIKLMMDMYEADKSKSEEKFKAEAEIAQATAKLESDIKLQRLGFVRRESEIYAKIYDDIVAATTEYAREHQIASVMHAPTETTVDASDGSAVLKKINRAVVWHDEQSDITSAILKRLIDKSQKDAQKEKQ